MILEVIRRCEFPTRESAIEAQFERLNGLFSLLFLAAAVPPSSQT